MVDTSEKTKRPANSAFKQQRLSAWQPILTAGTVLPTFFVIGILFIPVGIGLLFFSQNVHEKKIEYTDCFQKGENIKCADVLSNAKKPMVCECEPIKFNLTQDFKGKVFMYYALTNFYQNHRRYVKSRDDKQLLGKVGTAKNPVKPELACAPYAYPDNSNLYLQHFVKFIYFPCGAIANSMFTDEIELWDKDNNIQIPLLRRGIAWESDKQYKFKNSDWFNSSIPKEYTEKFVKPRDWIKNLWELDPDDPENNGLQNEDFIVWMRTAALPNFRKLYRIINHDSERPDIMSLGLTKGLPKGNYTLRIKYSFSVKPFGGTKSIVISTTSLLGGKNDFLGVSYIIVGALCLVLGIMFLFIHINYGKSVREITNVDSRTPF